MKRLINIGFLCLLFIAVQTRATPMLTGSVNFDDINGLYTYTYTLNTTSYEGNITIVDIWQNSGFYFEGPFPVSHTEPAGWQFVLSVGGVGNQPFGSPENIAGSFWSWWKNPSSNPIYSDIQTFSFTTERGVNSSQKNNYGLYNNGSAIPSAYVEVGHVVGPELVNINYPTPSLVPENETYVMMIAGLGVLGFLGRKKSRMSKENKML
jgi:hypothetical protein